MTDLEALECIVVDLTPKAKEHNKEEIEQLRKSLEVSEILKRYIDVSDNMIYVATYPNQLKSDVYKKIKEWSLDDDSREKLRKLKENKHNDK